MANEPRDYTVYVLGAGASHEGGVPLSSQILPVGYQLLQDLRACPTGAPGGGYLATLNGHHAETFQLVFDFIANFFQGADSTERLDLGAMPTLDELWGILEIGYSRRATFGRRQRPHQTARVRNALMALLYHVLVGCCVRYEPDGGLCATYDGCPNPYDEFVQRLGPADVVVALNYDTLLEKALFAAGLGIDYGTDVSTGAAGDAAGGDGRRRVTVLKLHGSFNWLWCPTCNTIEDFGGQNVAHIPLEEDKPDALCPIDGTPRDYVIIPPSLIKTYNNFHIQRIWDAAARALRACARLVFVGYAMADSDVYVKYLVKQATSVNPHLASGAGRIVAVNKSRAALEPYVRIFGEARVERHAVAFGEYLRRAARD